MKVKEIRNLSTAEMDQKVAGLKEELFNLRFQLATGQLENPMRIREVRKTIARIKTVQREEELKRKKRRNSFTFKRRHLTWQKKEMYAKCVRELSSAIRWIKPSLWLLNGKFPTNCTKNQLIQLKDLKHMTKTTNSHIGDTVRIVETRPLSRDKRWRVEKIVARQN